MRGLRPMTRKYVRSRTNQRSSLCVETLEDRSVPSTTSLDALGVQLPAWLPQATQPPALAPALPDVVPAVVTPAESTATAVVGPVVESVAATVASETPVLV